VTEGYLCRMRDTMSHRGPDGAGVWLSPDGQVGLCHRRLAIIDLSETANQPMCNEDSSLWIVFNGEIYNHAEIRSELERIGGHTWKTHHSDTEVILHAFEQWGIDCLHKFRGMFAIALWDAKERSLWLIRDRIGIKPLYYSIHSERITFASEIKALLRDPAQPRAVNEQALCHYLSFLIAPAPHTLFDGIQKLSSGTWIRVSHDGSVREHKYWDVLDNASPLHDASEEEIADLLLSELRRSVELRKVSDVPVGVFLSGGIDSTANACLFSENARERVKTFTIGYKGDHPSYADETPVARKVSQLIGSDHHELFLGVDDLVDFLPEMVRLQDEPIGDPVCVPVYYVSKLARGNGVTVAQVGEGSDELFCGYDQWKRILMLERFDELPLSRIVNRVGMLGLKLIGWDSRQPYEWLNRGANGIPLYIGGMDVFFEHQRHQLLSESLRNRLGRQNSWDAVSQIYQRFQNKAWDKSRMNWMTYVDLNFRLPELLLMRVDKMSMAVALEARVPFLDHKFVELVMGIPTTIKMRGSEKKHILKKAVRGMVPEWVIHRRKQGFWLPIVDWFMGRLGPLAREVVMDFCKQTDYLNASACAGFLSKFDDTRGAVRAWSLLNLALWWKYYIKDEEIHLGTYQRDKNA